MNKPFAVQVIDKSGSMCMEFWVGAQDKQSAIDFVHSYWSIDEGKLLAVDLSETAEATEATGLTAYLPRVLSVDQPHFLAVPVACGIIPQGIRKTLNEKKARKTKEPVEELGEPVKRPRGRPRKDTGEPPKRRGRPPKVRLDIHDDIDVRTPLKDVPADFMARLGALKDE
jgi:hypothetical protein